MFKWVLIIGHLFLLLSNANANDAVSQDVHRLLDSAKVYIFTDEKKSNDFYNQVYGILKKSDNRYGFGKYYFERSFSSIMNENYEQATTELLQGQSYLREFKDSILYLKTKHRIATTYFSKGEFNLSLKEFLETVSVIQGEISPNVRNNIEFRRIEAYCFKNIGVVEYFMFAEKKAIQYYNKAAIIFKEIDDLTMLRYCYNSIAGCYIENDDLNNAQVYIEKAEGIAEVHVSEVEKADFALTKSHYFLKTKQLDSSKIQALKSREIYEKFDDFLGIVISDVYLAEILLSEGKVIKASELLEKSHLFLRERGEDRILLRAELLLAEAYSKLKKHRKAYQLIKGALETQNIILKNTETFFSYEIENKVRNSQHLFLDSLNAISQEYKIDRYESEINEKSLYNKLLLVIILFFVVLTPTLFFLLRRNKKINSALKDSLNEKQVLFQEVHHRVKNNFQVISSLMNLQMRNSKDEKFDSLLRETRHRIISMSFVHELLYQSNRFDEISMFNYIEELVPSIINSFANEEVKIDFEVETNGILLDLNIAIPMGLILNETITNSVKYAFTGRSKGLISVKIVEEDKKHFLLIIKDNGIGIDLEEAKAKETLGFELIEVLVDQLDGEQTITSSESSGTEFRIKFKK